MTHPTHYGAVGPRPVVESRRVEGTRVYDELGPQIGTIRHLVIEKESGRVVYVVMTFGGFFGIGSRPHMNPMGEA